MANTSRLAQRGPMNPLDTSHARRTALAAGLLATALGALLLGTPPAQGQTPAAAPVAPGVQGSLQPAARQARAGTAAVGCLIVPARTADLGTPMAGVVERLAVDVGDPVRAGQVVATLRSDVESAAERAARQRLSMDTDVRIAETNLELAEDRLARARQLHGEGFISSQGVEQAESERRIAQQRLEQARGQRSLAARDLEVVRAQVGMRTLTAPFDGVVAERYRQVGERVEDRPLLRLVSLDPLRVDLVVPATRWGRYAAGDRVRLVPDLPAAQAVTGQVTHVDRVIDAASNTFRVRLSLPNPEMRLPAGARCALEGESDVAATPAPAPAQATAAGAATRPVAGTAAGAAAVASRL
jgi:cobalt-zinc-cadmium efflux system membrane fusion protein